jgi:hypothetical protein
LIIRLHRHPLSEEPLIQIHLEPDTNSCFIRVEESGVDYLAELGFHDQNGVWHLISASQAVLAPPDTVSEDQTARFATIPPDLAFEEIKEAVQAARQEPPAPSPEETSVPSASAPPVSEPASPPGPPQHPSPESQPVEGEETRTVPPPARRAAPPREARLIETAPLAEAVRELQSAGHPALPSTAPEPELPWSEAQAAALAQVLLRDFSSDHQRVWADSLEVTRLARRVFHEEIASPGPAPFGVPKPGPGAVPKPGEAIPAAPISSPFPALPGEQAKPFWFNVNVELIVYGATEPDAAVSIGGRRVRLRPDGTFSFRFSLPDGEYELPAAAISADGTDLRQADLRFARKTDYRGEVLAHPQEPGLRPPSGEHVA